MKVDKSKSRYHEAADATEEFRRSELRHCRMLLRRIQFLESKVRESGGLSASDDSGGPAFSELEMVALEFVLTEIGYLVLREPVSGNIPSPK